MIQYSLKEKIGQLFMLGFEGSTLSMNAPIVNDIVQRNLGGVILFDKLLSKKLSENNIISPLQVADLTSYLQDLTEEKLLIAVDQEGGMVARLKKQHGFPATPGAEELGNAADSEQTTQYSLQVARMLYSVGINFNLAPVIDLNVYRKNPIIGGYGRSFSDNPKIIFEHAGRWIRAHRQEGVLSCLKHFPGHGSSRSDSHLGFVDISATWNDIELQPYRDFIASNYREAIMVGHLFNCRFDNFDPATLSYATVHKILRSQLGFEGIIISDDMQMRAITDRYGLAEACCKAIAAGVDLLIIGNNLRYDPLILEKIQKEILRALNDGRLTEERIEEAWQRIQSFKNYFLQHQQG